MKKLIFIPILFLLSVFFVSAYEVSFYTEPYSDTFTTVSELGKSLDTIRTELGTRSCYVKENFETKSCEYLYFCQMILASDSTSVSDALLRECIDVTEKTDVTLEIKSFLPPKGVLYYVTTFITNVNYIYDDVTEIWIPTATIPTEYINAHAIRSVCPEGQMLAIDFQTITPKCYLAERVCIDSLSTGLCTNVYNIYALDRNMDGVVSETELVDASNYCADRPADLNKDGIYEYPQGDGVCDYSVSLSCPDVCSDYEIVDGVITCVVTGSNNLCDIWDQAAEWACWDSVLSPNSKICDNIDSAVCPTTYQPVCVGGTPTVIETGETIYVDGQNFPNSCFAEQNGFYTYTEGVCGRQITQCFVSSDCYEYAENLCIGGSTTGITVACFDFMCAFSGACQNMVCSTDVDCEPMKDYMPCVGPTAVCKANFCTIEGVCLTQPIPTEVSIWTLISQAWANFWAWVKGLFI